MANVLFLEPNILLAQAYAQALTLAGHTVRVVQGAQEAIHAADTALPDIVLLELQLPAHNGIEFLHEFRSYPEWQHIPVVVNTALYPVRIQAARQVLEEELGVVDVLYKPTATLADICEAVRTYGAGVAGGLYPGSAS